MSPFRVLFLAILTNSVVGGRDPEPRAFKIATLLLGKPERKAITLPEMDIEALVGVYENADGQARYITREGSKVFSQSSSSRTAAESSGNEARNNFQRNSYIWLWRQQK